MTAERILAFIPMYNAGPQIGRVISRFNVETQRLFSRIIVIDNRSTDDSLMAAAAALAKIEHCESILLRNKENYGLGGSHKVAFEHAIANGFDYCVVLHGDDQGSIHDLIPHIRAGRHHEVDCLLGARFMHGSRLEGYSPLRTLGNRVFNLLFSLACMHRLYDLGSGLNLYRTSALKPRGYQCFDDNLTFNYYLILASVAWGWKICFFPLTWREEDQRSNVKIARQAMEMLRIMGGYLLARQRFLQKEHRSCPRDYTAEIIQWTYPRCAPAAF